MVVSSCLATKILKAWFNISPISSPTKGWSPLYTASALEESPPKRIVENSVLTIPGLIWVTRMGVSTSSSNKVLEIASTACLEAIRKREREQFLNYGTVAYIFVNKLNFHFTTVDTTSRIDLLAYKSTRWVYSLYHFKSYGIDTDQKQSQHSEYDPSCAPSCVARQPG